MYFAALPDAPDPTAPCCASGGGPDVVRDCPSPVPRRWIDLRPTPHLTRCTRRSGRAVDRAHCAAATCSDRGAVSQLLARTARTRRTDRSVCSAAGLAGGCQAPGFVETGLVGFLGCDSRVGPRVC